MIRDWSNFIEGRIALVTGGGGGVGRAICIQLARAGAEVWVNDLHLERADGVVKEIEAERGTAHAVVADVTKGGQVPAMVKETGAVDILVNNAGIPAEGFSMKPFVETGPDEWDPLIRLNLAAVLGVTRAYLPFMIERQWGRILTIVSDAGRKGERKQVVYGAAKAAAMGFSRGLAAEVGRDGVTVNCISLGTMNHGPLAAAIERDPSLEEKLARAYPVGRIGQPADPAPLAVLLCSDATDWITGQVYPVDGGYVPAL
ncbi:MAG TPA: SDR family oxidoreductase [Acidimicrobiia bacterium]|nr:SDR family oxidoreductase [Acidimicrobiia bacterium]